MLQKYSAQENFANEDGGQLISVASIVDILKRRVLYFIIPAALIFGVGATIVMLIPPVYLAEGKILVESQQIPSELVKSTVSAVANERIHVISQRILTRDNLLSIAKKYQLFDGKRAQMTGTEMVDWMRANTLIKPVDMRIASRPNAVTLAFTVGFEHEVPSVALRVAGEFVTMILSEDVRVRTAFASETTKFLEREAKRLEAELNTIESKMADFKRQNAQPVAQNASDLQLTMLRAELMQKMATYSENHPDMKAIKQKIAALEKTLTAPKEAELGYEALERQQAGVSKNLQSASDKLVAARLGESLERGQQSERLEVIEQPTLPSKPIRPNRTKLLALAGALALAAGGGLVFALEAFQSTIYRTSDLARIVDSHLIVAIPYIATEGEMRRRRKKIVLSVGLVVLTLLIVGVVGLFFLPSYDVLLNKVLLLFGQ